MERRLKRALASTSGRLKTKNNSSRLNGRSSQRQNLTLTWQSDATYARRRSMSSSPNRNCNVKQTKRTNSEAREWRHDSDKTKTNKLESWMILKISLRVKAGVPKTLVKRNIKYRLSKVIFKTVELPSLVWCRFFNFSAIRSSFRHVHIRVYIYNIVQSYK